MSDDKEKYTMNKFKSMAYDLEGVLFDVANGRKFDDVCIKTIERIIMKLHKLAGGD